MSTVDGKFVNNKENKNYSRPDNIKIKEINIWTNWEVKWNNILKVIKKINKIY